MPANMKKVDRCLAVLMILVSATWLQSCSKSDVTDSMTDVLPGYAKLTGKVAGSEPGVLPVVFANNTEKDVAYTVFVINGEYRAVNLIPGPYDITIRAAIDQLEGFTPQTVSMDVAADSHVTADFKLENVGLVENYIGGVEYPDAEIVPYDELYPPGPGRDIMERTCHGCHSVNFYSYNVPRAYSGGRADKDKTAWGVTVDRMHKGPAFARPGKATIFDAALLPPEDRDILVDYLADNFGYGSEPRVVKLVEEPELDEAVLAKAMFIEYNYHEPEGKYEVWGWPHQVDFDNDGNVWLAYTACCIVKFDPRTGEQTVFEDHGGGHGIAVDHTDGTVWYSGDVVRHLDPKTGLVDHWKIGDDRYLGSNTQIFDSKGNLWLSLLAAGGLGKWDRDRDTIDYWEVPVVRSRPYGIIVDHKDKVWFADYHNGGVTRFDPDTEEFTHFNLVKARVTSTIRRLGVDSKGMIWASTWASPAGSDASLYRLDPETGDVMKRHLGLAYGAGYNAEADTEDNIWVAPDNYLTKYDQVADTMTHYPIPVRSDTLKTTITRDNAVWYIPRNAGKYAGYGGVAAVLYPDMDNIPTLAAYHSENSAGYQLSGYDGPPAPPVLGKDRLAPLGAQNAEEYVVWAKQNGLMDDD